VYKIPKRPLTILEIYGGTAAGLEALLRTGHHIKKYTGADTNPDTHTSTKHRLAQLQKQYPTQLPLTSITQWDNLLPLEPTLITTNNIAATIPEGIDILIAGLPTYTSPSTTKPTITNPHERAIKHIIQLTRSLYNTQTNKIGYLILNTPDVAQHPHTKDWLGPIITLDGPPCGSGAHRPTKCFQNLTPNSTAQTNFNNLPTPTLTTNSRLKQANFHHWKTQPTIPCYYHRHCCASILMAAQGVAVHGS
jgi:hypothetical protein